MPYKIKKQKDQFCVINTASGDNKGCSDTRDKAIGHMRRLYQVENEGKELTVAQIDDLVKESWRTFCLEANEAYDEEMLEKALADETVEKYWDGPYATPVWGATSYADLEAARAAQQAAWKIQDMVGELPMLVSNILASDQIEDKEPALVGVAKELAEMIPQKIQEEIDEEKAKREDASEADNKRAVAEYGDAKKGLPKVSNKGLLERAIEAIKGIFTESDTDAEDHTDERGVFVTKNASGEYVWFARYSNKWRDDDVPAEIISSTSHRRFVELVDKGLAPMPDLWLWHRKEWKIGRATWVAYDDEGFALAAGKFNPGCEGIAEWLSKQSDLGVSHGMPKDTLKRSYDDPTVIIEHETREISPIPQRRLAANRLADFVTLTSQKEDDMALSKDKKAEFFKKLGLPATALDAVEALNTETAKDADAAGIESKEAPETETTNTQTPTEPKPEEPKATPEVTDAEGTPPSRKEVAEALLPYIEKVDKALDDLQAVTARLEKAEKQYNDLSAALLSNTTRASLGALLAGNAIGDESTRVKEGDKLTDQKPKETPATETLTGSSMIDSLIMRSRQPQEARL